jgi:hypothetical protein
MDIIHDGETPDCYACVNATRVSLLLRIPKHSKALDIRFI